MSNASWQDVVDALGRGHYRRNDESTATELGELAKKVLDQYCGDLRRLHEQAEKLAALVDGADLPRLVAGCVRAAGNKAVVANVRAQTD